MKKYREKSWYTTVRIIVTGSLNLISGSPGMKDRRKTDREKENSTGKKFLLEESAFPSNPASTHSRYPSSMELQTPTTVLVRVRDSSQSGFNLVYAPAGLHRLSFPIPERYGHPTPNPDSRWLDQPSTGYP